MLMMQIIAQPRQMVTLNKAHHNQPPDAAMADEASTELEQASPTAEV